MKRVPEFEKVEDPDAGYGDAGKNAGLLRTLVGEARFRAAFVSGKVSLIGL